MRRADPIEPGERLVLDRLILGDRFDHEIDLAQILETDRSPDMADDLVLRARLELAPRHEAVERSLQPTEPALQQRLVGLDDDRRKAGLRRDLRDPRPHEPTPDHSNPLDGHPKSSLEGFQNR